MRTPRIALPALAVVGVFGLSGCGPFVSTSSSSSNGSSSSSSTSSESETSSQSPTSEESSTSEDSSSSSDSSSSTSSSSSSSGASVSVSDVRNFAKDHTVRACTISDIDVIRGGAQFCSTDSSSKTASYSGQKLYFTTADEFDSSASYTYTITDGSRSKNGTFSSSSSSRTNSSGDPVTLKFEVPMDQSGNYKATFKKNGTAIAEKSVNVTVD